MNAFGRRCLIASIPWAFEARAQISEFEAYQRALMEYKSAVLTVVQNCRNAIRPHLNRTEQNIESQIDYRVVTSGNTNASARYIDGQRRIVFSAGLFQILSFCNDAYNAQEALGQTGAFFRYMDYLCQGVADNTRLVQAGQPPRRVFGFPGFARMAKCGCQSFNAEELSRPDMLEHRKYFMEASIFFLCAHELAHHVLKHVDSDPGSLAESRAREAQADAWAYRQASLIHLNLLAALPTFFFLSSFSGNSIEDEVMSTHPLGIRRFQTMIRTIRDEDARDTSFASRMSSAGVDIVAYRKDVDALASIIDARMRQLGLN